MRNKIFLFLLMLLPPVFVTAQVTETEPPTRVEEEIERISEQATGEMDFTDLVEELLQYLHTPININRADEVELRRLRLNDLQISNLQDYRRKFGDLASIYELNLVEGFDSTLLVALQPFITFEMTPEVFRPLTVQNLAKYGRHTLMGRHQQVLQPQTGYSSIEDSLYRLNPNSRYLGGPERLYLRYGFRFYNRLRLGVTMEKDPGEVFLKGPDTIPKGFDFYSFHLFYQGNNMLRYVALGDYHVSFGQGLTMGSGFALSKTADAITSRRISAPLRPSAGVNENLFMRGAAITLSPISQADLTLFFSKKNVDASVMSASDTLSGEILYINSLQETGLHRTPRELAGKNAIGQTVYGANISSRIRMFRLGATATHTELEGNVEVPDRLYRKFDFTGNKLTNYGTDLAVIFNKATVFSEFSASDNGGMAFLSGVTVLPHPKFAASLLYRNYGRDYHNFFNNAFAEGSRTSNEQGLYAGFFVQFNRRWILSGYADYFQSQWLRYRVDSPSRGNEHFVQLVYRPSRYSDVTFRVRQQYKQINNSGLNPYLNVPIPEERNNYRIHFNHRASASITLKSRAELTTTRFPEQERRQGFLIYQDVIYDHPKRPWRVNLRYALFDTDTYNERMYAYESDVLYAFSIPAYYYKGSRFYAMTKYTFADRFDIWLRFAHTYYSNRQTIGSGLDLIDGNNKSEVKLQFRWRF